MNLIRRCKGNDRDALNRLLGQYEGYLYRLCYNSTRNRDEALDMMQEVYIRILNGLKNFDEKRPLLPWLKQVTVNTLINHSRKKKLPQTSLDGEWTQSHRGNVPEEYLAADNRTEDEVIFRDTLSSINDLIRELPEQYRLALILRYREEMSYMQIAAALGQPLGTVKNSVFRARSQLREKMLACNLLEV